MAARECVGAVVRLLPRRAAAREQGGVRGVRRVTATAGGARPTLPLPLSLSLTLLQPLTLSLTPAPDPTLTPTLTLTQTLSLALS